MSSHCVSSHVKYVHSQHVLSVVGAGGMGMGSGGPQHKLKADMAHVLFH